MKAMVFPQAHSAIVTEAPDPRLLPNEVLVKVHASGICGTDMHMYEGEFWGSFPVIPGHEFAGEIVEIGQAVTNWKTGQRVAVDPNIQCNQCEFCWEHIKQHCLNRISIGVTRDGGHAEYCAVPENQLVPVPEGLSYAEAAFAEPVACCVHGIDQAEIRPGQRVVILGGGTIGLILAQLARSAGASTVIVSDPLLEKRALALQLGVDVVVDPTTEDLKQVVYSHAPQGAEVIIEAVGRTQTAAQALELVRNRGLVLFFGVGDPKATIPLSPYDVYLRELTIRGSFTNPFTNSRSLRLIASGRVQVAPLIKKRFSLDEGPQALFSLKEPDSVKSLIVMED